MSLSEFLENMTVPNKNVEEIEVPTYIRPTVDVKIKTAEGVKIPKYAHEGDSGFDIYITEGAPLNKFKTRAFKTGLYMEIPPGYELQIRPRSGLSLKSPFRVANTPGTIDSTYRGEIKVIVQNVSGKTTYLPKGTKIAQGVICPILRANFIEAELSETTRGADGFGSTDKGE